MKPSTVKRLALAFAFVLPLLVPVPANGQALPGPACEALNKLDARFGALNQGNDDARRQFALIVAEDFAFRFPGEGWGTKSADPGRPQTKDAVARKTGATLEGWDLVDGGSKRVTCNSHLDLTGQNFIAVTPRNHLEDVVEPPPPPPPAPTSAADLNELKGMIADLKAIIERAAFEAHSTNEQLTAIAARPIVFPTYVGAIFGAKVTFTPK